MSVFVVDTGEREIYVVASAEWEAAEKVTALGEPFLYAEHFSDDEDDVYDTQALVR
jgi:hypothetical protein